jgi:hypothetical protein
MRGMVLALGIVALAGCQDRLYNSSFEVTGEQNFRYRGEAGAGQALDTPEGERARITQMEGWLRDNGLCRSGYVITSRIATKRNAALLGDVYDVNYVGRCS